MTSLIAVSRAARFARRKYLPWISLFFLCIELCAAQDPIVVLNLTAGNPASAVLANGGGIRLRVEFGDSQAQEIFLQTAVPDVAFRIVSGNGDVVQSGRIPTTGWAAIPIAAPDHRQLQIYLTLDHAIEGLSGVHLWVDGVTIPLSKLRAHDRAARLYSTAQALHNSLHADDLRLAILKYQQAAVAWDHLNDPYGVSIALGGKSEAQYELSQFSEALQSVGDAIGQSPHSIYLRAWLEHLEARVYLAEWEGNPAKVHAQESLKLAGEISEPALIAPALADLAEAIVYTGESQEDEFADKALSQALSIGLPDTVAAAKRVQAWIDEEQERMADALALLIEVQTWFHRAGNVRYELQTTEELGVPVNFTGDAYQALARSFKFEPISRASGDAVDWGVLVDNLGLLYAELGRPQLAAIYYKKARTAYSSAHFRFGLTLIYGELCEVESSLNQVSSALADCTKSLAWANQLGNPATIGMAQMRLGVAEQAAGNRKDALKHLDLGIRSSESVHDTQWEVKEHLKRGELMEADGDLQDAFSEYSKAQSLSKVVTDPAFLLEAQYHIAAWHLGERQYEQANEALKLALERVEVKRQSVSAGKLKASYFAAERKCYELGMNLRMQQFESDPASGGDARALELSEQSRARGLLDELKTRYTTAGREHAQVSLMRSNLAVDRAFDRRLKLLVEGGTRRDLDLSAAELTQALAALELAEQDVNSVTKQAPEPAATMTSAEIEHASLSSRATFFEYALGDERSYLWIISEGSRQSYLLPSRRQLEDMVNRWRRLAFDYRSAKSTTGAKLQHLSAQLSCALFADHLAANTGPIIIVPDGQLALLPFAALPQNGCSKTPGEPLVTLHQISLTPSLSIFFASKSAGGSQSFQGEVAVIADPVFDATDSRALALKTAAHKAGSWRELGRESGTELPRLINSGYEASAIKETVRRLAGNGQVFMAQGFDANLETVLSPRMQGYRVWHLATHGVYDESIPEFSGLVFSLLERNGASRFGFLKAQDIAQLNVPAELVILSACDSAAGDNVNGEGVMGLSYAFLHAGAKQVISTLWSVDDRKSRELMIPFYQEFMRNNRNAAEALRRSQMKLMRNPTTSAPYYWAGFTLTTTSAN
jgi:CHAT domain-containing protein